MNDEYERLTNDAKFLLLQLSKKYQDAVLSHQDKREAVVMGWGLSMTASCLNGLWMTWNSRCTNWPVLAFSMQLMGTIIFNVSH